MTAGESTSCTSAARRSLSSFRNALYSSDSRSATSAAAFLSASASTACLAASVASFASAFAAAAAATSATAAAAAASPPSGASSPASPRGVMTKSCDCDDARRPIGAISSEGPADSLRASRRSDPA